MSQSTHPAPPYRVRLLDAPQLTQDQQAACELRFRMALEFSLGGPDMVIPSLKAWHLAMDLAEELPLEAPGEAEREVIALWETAESDALIAAFRPLGKDMGEARFEIFPA
jgi:hypothetical protein